MIAQLEPLNRIIGTHILTQHILLAIQKLANDKQWRNRLSVIEKIPNIAKTCVSLFLSFYFYFIL